MPKNFPTYVAQDPGVTSKYIPPAVTPIDISGLAKGLQQLGAGLAHRREAAKKLLEAQEAKRADLWVNKQVVEAERFLTKYSMEAAANPSTTAADDFDKVFAKYQEESGKSAPSAEALEKYNIRLGALGNDHYGKALQRVSAAHAINAVNDIDTMVGAARDSMALTMDYESLQGTQQYIMSSIENSRGLLSNEAIDKQLQKVQNLSLEAVRMWAPEDPELARQVLADIKDLPGDVRRRELDNIDKIEKQGKEIDRVGAQNALDSMRSQVDQGVEPDPMVIEQAVALAPEESQASLREELNAEFAIRKDGYNFTQRIRGASEQKINQIVEEYRPAAGDKFHDKKQAAFEHIQKLADAQKKMIQENPYGAAMQSPAMKPLIDAYVSLPAGPEKNAAFQEMIRANLALQEDHENGLGLERYETIVADTDEIKTIVERLNKGTPQEIIDGVNQYNTLYGEFSPDLFRNVQAMPNNAGLSPYILTILDHIGTLPNKETPAYVHEFLTANKAPLKDLGIEEKSISDTVKTLSKDRKGLGKLADAMRNSGKSEEEISKMLYGIARYHEYRKVRGENDIDQVIDQFANSQYTFGEVNGVHFALPKSLGVDDREAGHISFGLSQALQFPAYDEERYKSFKSGKTVPKSTLWTKGKMFDLVDFLATPDGAKANNMFYVHSQAEAQDALRGHAYWQHVEGTDQMMLMSRGGIGLPVPIYKEIQNKGTKEEKYIPFTVSISQAKDAWADYQWGYKRNPQAFQR